MSEPTRIFNRALLKTRRERVAEGFGAVDFLKRELAERLADRLEDMARCFPLALDLGCHRGELREALRGRGGIKRLIQADYATAMAARAQGETLVADEETLPFAEGVFDLVMSAGTLHWVNDLPGTLTQIRRILKPDGLFLAILPGAQSLCELREAFAAVEAAFGAIRPHVAPFVEVRDAGNLLQRAGFALPVVDSDLLHLSYAHPLSLLRELQAMGETNPLLQQEKGVLPRGLIPAMCEAYGQRFSAADGRICATMELVTLTAWSPHASQQQPARRGSGQVNLGDALTTLR